MENTVMLYVLQFTNMFVGLVTVPLQTRVLGPGVYGKLSVAVSMMMYVQLLMDFGFIMSAVAKISAHRDEPQVLSKVLSCVTWAKLFFFSVSLIVVCVFILPGLESSNIRLMYFFCLLNVATNSFLPDYMYRGLERMSVITMRTVMIKVFFAVMLFLFLRRPDQSWMIPGFTTIGNLGAAVFVYWHLIKKVGVHFCKVTPYEVFCEVKGSFWFFVSKISATVYSSANTLILGYMDPSGILAGIYSTPSDKIITPARNMIGPISDSLYPHMIKHKNYRLVKKLLCFMMPVILLGCAVVFIFAEPICTVFFGAEYAQSAAALRALLPVVVFTLPNYVLGFPTLGAMGLAKYANFSTLFCMLVHLVNLAIAYFTGNLNTVTLCLLTSLAELLVLLFRVTVIFLHRDRLRAEDGK